MKKAKAVASLRLSPKTKTKLERVSRQRNESLSATLSRIVEEYDEPSTEELEQRSMLIGNIVEGLRFIDANDDDLEELQKQVADICSGLKAIDANDDDLEELQKQVADICSGLKKIAESEVEVDS
jgi:predicted transcriptional regulator